MSALAMILTAAMTVPGDGPEKVSAEVVEPKRPDLRGDWLLTFRAGWYEVSGGEFIYSFKFRDEGGGKCRMTFPFVGRTESSCVGIYRQEKENILICIRKVEDGRPTRFQDDDGQRLLVLRRVKSRK